MKLHNRRAMMATGGKKLVFNGVKKLMCYYRRREQVT